jgi:hypothetical protein
MGGLLSAIAPEELMALVDCVAPLGLESSNAKPELLKSRKLPAKRNKKKILISYSLILSFCCELDGHFPGKIFLQSPPFDKVIYPSYL